MTRIRACAALVVVVAVSAAAIGLRVPATDGIPEFATVRARWQPSDAYLFDRNGVQIDSARIDYGVRRFDWVPLDALSPALIDAVVAGEDHRFWTHRGVDWRAAIGALRDNLTGARPRGASTITMQLASMLEAAPNTRRRGWSEKLAQVRAARMIESRWTKPQILEAYLNLLGFRGELAGVDAAARLLAGKAPSGLSLPESLVLAALLPAPGASAGRVAARACARARMASVACEEIETTALAMLTRAAHLSDAAGLAPDLARSMLDRPGQHLLTTLDANVQTLARDVMHTHLKSLAANLTQHNVRDGAALVVDNATGDVLAYVGSAGSASLSRHVDGVRAHRQAGSTLKPFLYGLALERRYLTNASLLDDSAINLDTATGVYLPQNYDRDFKGLVSVRTALGSSLNVPAVRALVLVGVEAFRDRLHALGYARINEDGAFYGYSLALGSAEVSLWEQVNAYRTLARGGIGSPLRLRGDDPVAAPTRILAADASFLVTDILGDRAARVATFGLDNNLNTAFWSAAKTGTSKDLRDNWCIGFSETYTVGVWVGNFEGDSMRNVSGVTGAAPAWHDIIVALHARRGSNAPTPPPGVTQSFVAFAAAVEPSRREWFATDTELAMVATVPERATRPHIASPGNGLVIAIDPDIPARIQRVPMLARGATQQLEFRLDGVSLGPAGSPVLWPPRAGAHRLALMDAAGAVVDQVLFTVR